MFIKVRLGSAAWELTTSGSLRVQMMLCVWIATGRHGWRPVARTPGLKMVIDGRLLIILPGVMQTLEVGHFFIVRDAASEAVR